MLSDKPYIEGAWMDKYQGKYYLQYAFAGTQYNIYGDGVMVGESPLGPFKLAENNPYSYKPGGFIPGAGHGSTMWDKAGNLWHTSTMRISKNHQFERRVGLWRAGFDEDGELFCNQRYGDWPMAVTEEKDDPWKNPEWFLLSAGKMAQASSYTEGKEPQQRRRKMYRPGGRQGQIHRVSGCRLIWDRCMMCGQCRLILLMMSRIFHALEKSVARLRRAILKKTTIRPDGSWKAQQMGNVTLSLRTRSEAKTDLPHDLVVRKEGIQVRYVRLTIVAVPYGQKPCISGLRVFGIGTGRKPEIPGIYSQTSG